MKHKQEINQPVKGTKGIYQNILLLSLFFVQLSPSQKGPRKSSFNSCFCWEGICFINEHQEQCIGFLIWCYWFKTKHYKENDRKAYAAYRQIGTRMYLKPFDLCEFHVYPVKLMCIKPFRTYLPFDLCL